LTIESRESIPHLVPRWSLVTAARLAIPTSLPSSDVNSQTRCIVILGERALGLGFSLFLLQFSFYPASNNLVSIVHTYANCMWGTLSGESIVVILAGHLACRSDFTWLRVKVLQPASG
jgi:hypothetical protein